MLIGKAAVGLALILGAASFVCYAAGGALAKQARRLFYLAALTMFFVEGYLISLLLGERYEFEYVWQFSERNIAWFYKVSGAWAGQEGSFLLWATLTALLGVFIVRKLGKLERPFMSAYSLIMVALIGIIAFKPPFTYHTDDGQAEQIKEGTTITRSSGDQTVTIEMPAPPVAKVEIAVDGKTADVKQEKQGDRLTMRLSTAGMADGKHQIELFAFMDPSRKLPVGTADFVVPLQQFLTDPSTGKPFAPRDGRGLVPSLENYWMAIHPPVMFGGFSSLAILFCFAIAGMVTGDRKMWQLLARPWAALSAALTGFGLCLGGFWAYETLGWGGFWAWDPVENVALIPWLGAIALLHGLYVYATTGRYSRANLFLAAFPFLAFMFGTFLTRSGTLAEVSVHSFDGLEHETKRLLIGLVELSIVGFVSLFTYSQYRLALPDRAKGFARRYGLLVGLGLVFLALGLFVPGAFMQWLKWPLAAWALAMLAIMTRVAFLPQPVDGSDLPRREREKEPILGRRQGIIAGVVVIVVVAGITLVGTAWPWLTFLASGKSVKLEPPFYNTALAVPAACILIFCALVPFLGWHKTEGKRFFGRLVMPWTAAVMLAILGFLLAGIRDFLQLFFAVLAFLAITANLWRVSELIKRSRVTLGGFISHVGLAAMLLGMIVSMSFEREAQAVLPQSGSVEMMGFTVTRAEDAVLPASTDSKLMRTVGLKFQRGNRSFVARPEYWERATDNPMEPQRMTRPWIKRGVDSDFYVAINPPEETYFPQGVPMRFKPGEVRQMPNFSIERLNEIDMHGEPGQPGTAFTSQFRIKLKDTTLDVEPALVIAQDGQLEPKPARLDKTLAVAIVEPDEKDGSIGLQFVGVSESVPITLFYKPLTVLVWFGAGIMALGGLMSARRRAIDSRALAQKQSQEPYATHPASKKQNPPRARNLRKSRLYR